MKFYNSDSMSFRMFLILAMLFVLQMSNKAMADDKGQNKINTIAIEFQNQNGQLLFKTPIKGTTVMACCDGGDSGTDRGSWDPELVSIDGSEGSEHLKKTLLKLLITNYCLEKKLNKKPSITLTEKILAEGLLTVSGTSLSITLVDPLPENLSCILNEPVTFVGL